MVLVTTGVHSRIEAATEAATELQQSRNSAARVGPHLANPNTLVSAKQHFGQRQVRTTHAIRRSKITIKITLGN